MMTCENPRIILKGKWKLVRIIGKNNTIVRVKDLRVDMTQKKHEQVLNYYDDLLARKNNKSFSIIRSIICEENITGINYQGDILTLSLENEPVFFGEKPKVKIFLNTPDIKDKKEEVLEASIENYGDSRGQFLDKSLENKKATYLINTKSKDMFYTRNNNDYVFNLSDHSKSSFYNFESCFLTEAIDLILSSCGDVAYINNYDIFSIRNDIDSYYVKNFRIEVGEKVIVIDILFPEEYENIMNLVNKHNKTVEEIHIKKQIKKENNDE